MKVSVVIPAYNEEARIEQCLRAIFDQEVPADEVIVVDNNSRDKTAEIATKLGARVVLETQQGITPARNRGFNEARYEIIARSDADTIVPRDWIKKVKQNFEDQKIDALSGPISYSDSLLVPKSPMPSIFFLGFLHTITFGTRFFTGMNMSLTKHMWLRVRDIAAASDKHVHEDMDLSMKIKKSGGVMGWDPTLIVESSARRMVDNPHSFFIEYPLRLVRTFWENRNMSSFPTLRPKID